MTLNNVSYICRPNTGIELILCENSTISYPTHNHASVLTVGLVLDGSIALTVRNDVNIYEKNQTFAIYPYVPHSIFAVNPYTLLVLCINKSIIREKAPHNIKNSVIDALKAENIDLSRAFPLLDRLDTAIGLYAYKNIQLESHIEQLKAQLELYPERKFCIDEMAQYAFMSKFHFIRSFKSTVGLTPHQFQLQNRIRKAQRSMRNAKSLTEVALTAGFCDQSHFIKQFEKIVGLSPLSYKSSCKVITENQVSTMQV